MAKVSYVVGLMSGTSLDGMDAALVKVSESEEGIQVDLVHFISMDYSEDVQSKLLKLCHPDTASLDMISKMNVYVGEVSAEATIKVVQEAKMSIENITLVSSHGQTIYHQPDIEVVDGRDITSTFQIGDISVIAEKTGITTVGDFRSRDMAAGGQGAPLVSYADYMLFQDSGLGRVLLNIGGIANMTILPANAREQNVIAYDTGPGNMTIDAFAKWATGGKQMIDQDGWLAAQGRVNKAWLDVLLEHEYFNVHPPKSTGRELFGEQYAIKLWEEARDRKISEVDRLATITELTARTIADEIKKYVGKCDLTEVLISGGGRYNPTLMKRIRDNLPSMSIKPTDDINMDADAKEAIAFALLGYQYYYKRTNSLPFVTGASRSVKMGKIAW